MLIATIALSIGVLALAVYCVVLHRRIRLAYSGSPMRRKKSPGETFFTQSQLFNVTQQAGVAELNEGILKNIYHILNTVNVSTTVLAERAEKLEIKSLARIVSLLEKHRDDLPTFLGTDERGKKVPEALIQLSHFLSNAHESLMREIQDLSKIVNRLYQIVKAQQAYAEVKSRSDETDLARLIDDALIMEERYLEDNRIVIVKELDSLPVWKVPKIKLLQVVITLLKNGCETLLMQDPDGPREIVLRTEVLGGRVLRLEIGDARALESAEVVDPLASPSDSTTLTRRHFSLYYCANAIMEMRGSICIFSEEPGHGALMRVELPLDSGNTSQEIVP